MKDGRTHLAYKAEHAVELGSGLIVAPVVYRGDDADAETLPVTVEVARQQLAAAGSPHQVEEVVGDKGYHKAETLQTLAEVEQVRAYIAEPKRRGRRVWQDKPEGQQQAVYANRQRINGRRGRRLGRQRSEYAERSFAHTCETGGGRRAWLRGVMNVSKHHLMRAAACNLGIIMLALCGVGTPRTLQGGLGILFATLLSLVWLLYSVPRPRSASGARYASDGSPILAPAMLPSGAAFSTGC
jgi:transposase